MRHRYSYQRDYKRTQRKFWEKVRQKIAALFPERAAVFYHRGQVSQRRLSSNFQLGLSVFAFFFTGWITYASYIYFRYNHILDDNTAKVEKAHEQYKQILSYVRAYEQQISIINDKIDAQNVAFAQKMNSKDGPSKEEKETFFKEQQMLAAELGYFNKKIRDFSTAQGFAEINKDEIYYQLKNAEIQRDVAWKEQNRVKERNAKLETSLVQIRSSYEGLLDKMETLASGKIKDFETQFAGFSRTLDQLGLKDANTLLSKLEKEERVSTGGPFIPLKEDPLPTEDLTNKYENVREKINLWEGLTKVKEMMPLGNPVQNPHITSTFGSRKDPFTGRHAMHNGIDFGGKVGTPLYTVSPGRVVRAGLRGAYGYTVEVDHGLGFSTLYGHLSKISVQVGDELKEHDIVGLAGSTGRSTGPHLHYEVRYNGRAINPYAFVKARFVDYGKGQ